MSGIEYSLTRPLVCGSCGGLIFNQKQATYHALKKDKTRGCDKSKGVRL